jgi:hypothetical protein
MSHRHFCDFAGHHWECEGTALRLFAGHSEPTVCMCLKHQVSMEEGDHSKCPVELLACPGHRDVQLRKMIEFGTGRSASRPWRGKRWIQRQRWQPDGWLLSVVRQKLLFIGGSLGHEGVPRIPEIPWHGARLTENLGVHSGPTLPFRLGA